MNKPLLALLLPVLGACTREPRAATVVPGNDRPAQRAPSDAPTAAPAAPAPTPAAPAPLDAQRALATASNALGVDLYRRLGTGNGNLALSPASIALAFGMTAGGARVDTLEQMRAVLHHSLPEAQVHAALGALARRWNQSREGFTLATANRLFGHTPTPFEAPFVALTRDTYGAPMERVDFAQPEPARAHINRWVATQTRDKITELLPPRSLDALTRLVLVNALYLHAAWRHPFPAARTQPGSFHAPSGEVQAPLMRMTQDLPYAEAGGVKVLEMPYVEGDYVMDVILPDARDGLEAVESRLSAAQLATWCEGLSTRRVDVTLPRFRVGGATVALRETMSALGMPRAFDRDAADFTGMSNPPNAAERLYIANAYHQVFVDVREAGTEAAAATAVVMAARGGMMQRVEPATFTADHPFLWMIRDRATGAVLFMGRVNDPR